MKKMHFIFGLITIFALTITFTACPNMDNSDDGGGVLDYDEDAEAQLLDATFIMNTSDSKLTISTKTDGTFTATETSLSGQILNQSEGTYLRKNDLLRITDSKESHFFKVKDDNLLEPYTLNLQTAGKGYGNIKLDKSNGKLKISCKKKDWFQVGIPYSKDLADGCAYVYGNIDLWVELAIGKDIWGKDDNNVGRIGKQPYLCNLDSDHSFLLVKAQWNPGDSAEISKIVIGPKNDDGYNPYFVDSSNYKSKVPDDTNIIFDAITSTFPGNFIQSYWGYSTDLAFDSTIGKVLRFKNYSEDVHYAEANFKFNPPIDLKDKTLYMLIKGKSNLNPSDYSDLKITVCTGDGGSETYNFIPTNDEEYVVYSATNAQFWKSYDKSAAANFSNIDSLIFNMQMATYDFKIAAIYYK